MNGTENERGDGGSSSLMMTKIVKSHASDVNGNSDDNGDDTLQQRASDASAEADAVMAEGSAGTDVWEPSGNWWRDMLYFCGPGA